MAPASDASLVMWGIPSCGTVKKARAALEAAGLVYRFADLRESPPSRAHVARWVATFGAKALRNTSGGAYRALPKDKDGWSDAQWLDAFAAEPMLIKRPVIERGDAPLIVGFRNADALRALR